MVTLIRVPQNGMHLSAMQIVKGFKRGEPTFLATLVRGVKSFPKEVSLPHWIEQVLSDNRDVMPEELSQRLQPEEKLFIKLSWFPRKAACQDVLSFGTPKIRRTEETTQGVD